MGSTSAHRKEISPVPLSKRPVVETSQSHNVPSEKGPSTVKTSWVKSSPVWQPVGQPATVGQPAASCMQTFNRPVVQPVVQPLSTACAVWQPRLNNWLHRVNKHSTGCETGWTTGLKTGWIFFTRCSQLFNRFDICDIGLCIIFYSVSTKKRPLSIMV